MYGRADKGIYPRLSLDSMRAIISGASGAVGMALIKEIIDRGDEVLVLCRPSSQRSARLFGNERVSVKKCDMRDYAALESCDVGEGYDVFFHLAWAGTNGVERNDVRLQLENVRYTLDALELAARLGCSVFVGAGSQAEYGRTACSLSSKTPTFPENAYGMAKLCASQMSRALAKRMGIRHVWARIISVYGPYDNENSLISTAIRQLLLGEKTAFTPCEQAWDYIFSYDLAKCLIALAEDGRDGGVYCLGGGKTRRLREYVEIIRNNIDPQAPLGFGALDYPEGQVMHLRADVSELERDTKYTPSTAFEDGIKITVEAYKNKLGLEK